MEPAANALTPPTSALAPSTIASPTINETSAERLFAGGGEVGALLANVKWAETSLGAPETWPQSLRASLRICLTNRHPLLVWWGPDLLKFYNDAYSPALSKRHPWALGKPAREVWPEIWDVLGPMLEGVLATGQATWSDDQLLLLERNGYQEETYFTYSYSPIEDELGAVGGVFTTVAETTQRVLGERRGRLASDLAAALVDARSVKDVCAYATGVIARDPDDIPFALLYTIDAAAKRATLRGTVGIAPNATFYPDSIDLVDPAPDAPSALAQAALTKEPVITRKVVWPASALTAPVYLTPHTTLTLPVIAPGLSAPTALLVVGVSPRLALDTNYQGFYHALVSHLASAFAATTAYEAEQERAEALAAIGRDKTAIFDNVSQEFHTPLTLMLGPLAELNAPTAPPHLPLTPISDARILVADDNADRRDYLVRLLSERYQVEAVNTGTQALLAIQRNPPDLALCDVMMPELDGFTLLERLRAEPRTASLPVILLSARASEEATIEGLERGANEYLIKPFSSSDVLSRVAARLEIARVRQQAERRTRQVFDALLELAELTVGDDPNASASARMARRQRGPTTAHALVALAREVIGCEVASLVGVAAETDRLIPLATLGRSEEHEAGWYATLGEYEVASFYTAENLRKLRAGEVIIANVRSNRQRGAPQYGSLAALTAPLRSGATLYGLLTFAYHDSNHLYTEAERELAAGFGRMALLILERNRLLAERAEAQAQAAALQESTRRMNEFLGVASHELRTPLTSISANIQIGQRMTMSLPSVPPDALATRLERLRLLLDGANRQAQRLDRLVGDLLDVSRISSGKLELRIELCDLGVILNEMIEAQRLAWPGRQIKLRLPRRAPLPLLADPDRIGQVITNFLVNALKYAPETQPVEVTAKIEGDLARVSIRDCGPGIPLREQSQLFDAFYRAQGVTQLNGSGVGLGLGLHICKNIIERHNGALGVISAPGEGSTFWFTLPLALAASAPHSAQG